MHEITFPIPAKFLLVPDKDNMQLYILHTEEPKCLIYVHQSTPQQLYIIDDFDKHDDLSEDEYEQLFTPVLFAAKNFYIKHIESSFFDTN